MQSWLVFIHASGTHVRLPRSSTATACVHHTQTASLCPVGWSLAMNGWRSTSGTTWTSTSALLALRTSGRNTCHSFDCQSVLMVPGFLSSFLPLSLQFDRLSKVLEDSVLAASCWGSKADGRWRRALGHLWGGGGCCCRWIWGVGPAGQLHPLPGGPQPNSAPPSLRQDH